MEVKILQKVSKYYERPIINQFLKHSISGLEFKMMNAVGAPLLDAQGVQVPLDAGDDDVNAALILPVNLAAARAAAAAGRAGGGGNIVFADDQLNNFANVLADAVQHQVPLPHHPPRGGYKKLRPLSSATPEDWIDWRDHFSIVQAMNGWNNQRARREIAASMTGSARRLVRSIQVGDEVEDGDDDAEDFVDLLDAYGQRFQPTIAVEHLKMKVRCAQQKEDETINEWLGRYRDMYDRAYPELVLLNGDIEEWPDAITGFVNGLRHKTVAHDTRDKNPDSMTAALTAALNSEANRFVGMNVDKTRGELPKDPLASISKAAAAKAIQQMEGSAPGGPCHYCGKPGHFKRDCEHYQRAQVYYDNRKKAETGGGGSGQASGGSSNRSSSAPYDVNQRGRGGKRGRGGRGGSSRGGSSGSDGATKRIQQVDSTAAKTSSAKEKNEWTAFAGSNESGN